MTWESLDWSALERLRARFLHGTAAAGPYWETSDDLATYDFTYGERIGWKWDQVLRELRMRGWRPRARTVLDWGCGSGIAARRVMAHFGADGFDSLAVWDHSPLAADFAADAAQRAFPTARVWQATPGFLAGDEPVGLLVISHVLNELSTEAKSTLRTLAGRADAILWVEPGTHDASRQLGRLRDELRSAFRPIAPCTHELGCPILAPGNDRHWCHFFAPPPAEIFADSNWVKFGQRAGIDLRSLPYSFFAMEHRTARPASPVSQPPAADPAGSESASPGQPPPATADLSRVIGRPEHFKPYARVLNCDATGLNELELPKRADPALFKQLERTKAPLIYHWQREGTKILGGTGLLRSDTQ